jgi:hypothetical protein
MLNISQKRKLNKMIKKKRKSSMGEKMPKLPTIYKQMIVPATRLSLFLSHF